MKDWIVSTDDEKKHYYPKVLKQFKTYFQHEMEMVKDESLKQEIKVIDQLIDWSKCFVV